MIENGQNGEIGAYPIFRRGRTCIVLSHPEVHVLYIHMDSLFYVEIMAKAPSSHQSHQHVIHTGSMHQLWF